MPLGIYSMAQYILPLFILKLLSIYGHYIKMCILNCYKNPCFTWFCAHIVSQLNIFRVTYWILNKTEYISTEDIQVISLSRCFELRLYYHSLHRFITQMDLGFPCFYNIGKVQRRVFSSFFVIFCSSTTPLLLSFLVQMKKCLLWFHAFCYKGTDQHILWNPVRDSDICFSCPVHVRPKTRLHPDVQSNHFPRDWPFFRGSYSLSYMAHDVCRNTDSLLHYYSVQ